jgi:glycerol-3-phosphate dehydrogenase
VLDRLTGDGYEVRARHVVNATGVWVDGLLAMADEDHAPAVQPSKGVHVVVPRERLPLDATSVLLPSRQGDGRSMFAIPWGRQTILGTTDTAYDGPLDALALEQRDLDYVIAAGNAVFRRGLTEDDVLAAWVGARPLLRTGAGSGMGGGASGRTLSDVSRRHSLTVTPSGLVTITGGKLTTYRRMAADVVDLLVERDGRRARCRTAAIPLGCARPLDDVVAEARQAARAVRAVPSVRSLPSAWPVGTGGTAGTDEVADLLVRQHGEAAPDVLALVAADPALGAPLSPAAPHLFAEVVYAARYEGAATLEDVFGRRTRLSLRARDAALPAAPRAARLLAAELGRPPSWADEQVEAYADVVGRERGVLGRPVERRLAG